MARDKPTLKGGDVFTPERGGQAPASVGEHKRWRGTGPRPTMKGGRFYTGARGTGPREHCGARTMARDRPSPYGKVKVVVMTNVMARDRPSPYDEGGRFSTGARGPVPREHWGARTMARDRPSPYRKVKIAVILNFC